MFAWAVRRFLLPYLHLFAQRVVISTLSPRNSYSARKGTPLVEHHRDVGAERGLNFHCDLREMNARAPSM